MLISAHVADLKGRGTHKEREAFLQQKRARFGKMTLDLSQRSHVDNARSQDVRAFANALSQAKGTAQLRPMCLDAAATTDWENDSR